MTLYQEAKHLLSNRPRWLTYEIISENTGVTVAWLKTFAGDDEKNFGILKVQELRDYLKDVLTDV